MSSLGNLLGSHLAVIATSVSLPPFAKEPTFARQA
jgi:hypothetical protein